MTNSGRYADAYLADMLSQLIMVGSLSLQVETHNFGDMLDLEFTPNEGNRSFVRSVLSSKDSPVYLGDKYNSYVVGDAIAELHSCVFKDGVSDGF